MSKTSASNGKTKATPTTKATAESTKPTIPAPTAHRSTFDELPNSAFVRQSQLVPNPKRRDIPAPLPISAATMWRKVNDGTFPAPVKLGERITCWEVGKIRQWMQQQAETPFVGRTVRKTATAATV